MFMGKGPAILLIVTMAVGWLVFENYAGPAAEGVITDVQAYNSRSLLPDS